MNLLDFDLPARHQEAWGQSGCPSIEALRQSECAVGGGGESGCKGLYHVSEGLFIWRKKDLDADSKLREVGCIDLFSAGSLRLAPQVDIGVWWINHKMNE